MLLELKKEEALSLICIPHWTYCCLTSRLSSYFIQLFNVPLQGVARFTFLCKFDCLRSFDNASSHCNVDQYGAATLLCHHSVTRYYWAPTRLQHHQLSSHGGAVQDTNTALTLPAVIARWSSTTGHQRGFNIASRHCTGAWYGAPTLLQYSLLLKHSGAVLQSNNVALTKPAFIALWRGMGHPHGFDIACHHSTGALYGVATLLHHHLLLSHCGAVLQGTNAASTLPANIALWSGTMGHQRGLEMLHTVQGAAR